MERLSGDAAVRRASGPGAAAAVGWSDVGAWSALWEVREQDAAGNVLDGDAFVHDAVQQLVIAQQRMVAAVGVDN
jgi:mannose-1-phosphate guanylyltransferase/mannose-6-phosphate isomerase